MARRFTWFEDIGDLETDYLYGRLGAQVYNLSSQTTFERDLTSRGWTVDYGPNFEQALPFYVDLLKITEPMNAEGPVFVVAVDDVINASTAVDVFSLFVDNGSGVDSDAEDDVFQITHINGIAVVSGDSVTLTSGLIVTIALDANADTVVRFSQPGLTLGDIISDTFSYTITDTTGDTSTANVAVNFLQNGFSAADIDGVNGFTLNGVATNDQSGTAVSGIGDINGDGIDDVIITAPFANATTGEAYIVFGTNLGFGVNFELSDLFAANGGDGSAGFVVNGVSTTDAIGTSVSGAGDINGDGIDDFIIGAANAFGFAGQSYVVFGSNTGFSASFDLSTLSGGTGNTGFVIHGINANDLSGTSVSSIGDFNGDGFDDLIVGARDASPGSVAFAGQSYVIFGTNLGFPSDFDLDTIDGSNGLVIDGIDAFDQIGSAVSGIGDFNGDGLDDILIGAPNAGPAGGGAPGQSYVVFGTTTVFTSGFQVGALNGANGFTINGVNNADLAGASVSGGGDFNGDGITDLIIGAPNVTQNGLTEVGAAYVVFGSTSAFGPTLALGALEGTDGFVVNGIYASEHSGLSVANAGDFNGDGFDDIVIAAPSNGQAGTHGVYILYGAAGGFNGSFDLENLDGTNGLFVGQTADNMGRSVAAAGDVNADGFADVIIGSSLSTPNGFDSGESYIIFGFAANNPPNAADDDFGADEDAAINGNVFDDNGFGPDEDVDGDTFFVSEINGSVVDVGLPVAGDNGGQFIIADDGTFSFDPIGDFEFLAVGDSLDTAVTYTIDDGFGGTSTAIVTVTVNGVNDAPIAEDDFFFTDEDSPTGGNVFDDNDNGIDTDVDGDTLTVATVNGGSANVGNGITGDQGGIFTINVDGSFDFDPAGDFEFLAVGDSLDTTVTYTIEDGNGGVSTASVVVTVEGVNNNPFAAEDSLVTDEDTIITASVFSDNGFGFDDDPEGDIFTVTAVNGEGASSGVGVPVNGEGGGIFTISADGSLSFDPNGDFEGLNDGESSDTMVTYTIDDGNGGTSAADVIITVMGISSNEVPLAQNDAFDAGEASQVAGSVFDDNGSGADSDPDGDALTVTQVDGSASSVGQLVTGSNGGAFLINADGTFNFDPGTDFNTLIEGETVTSSITYTIDDGHGGTDTATVTVTITGAPPPSFDLADLDGTNGFAMTILNADDEAGFSVANAGDVNGDGIDDLLVGSHFADPGGTLDAGQTYVVFGGTNVFDAAIDLTALDGSDGFAINGINQFDNSGWAIAAAGDVNGDGIDDIMVSAQLADSTTAGQIGQTYVVFGSAAGFSANLNVADLNGTNGFTINGIDADDQSGYSVSGAGDVNGDGIEDMIIGARAADPNGSLSGETYVVFGSSSGFGGSLDLADLNGANGFVINGEDANDRSGRTVSSAGDVNGDGIDDILIGANRAENGAAGADSGRAYVVFGSAAGFGASLELSDINGINGFAMSGVNTGDFTGFTVANAGDFNGDGIDDVIIGAPSDGAAGVAGAAYMVFGNAAGFAANLDLAALDGTNGFAFEGIAGDDQFGFSVTGAGDVNGDGLDDVLIGAPQADGNGNAASGQAYLIFGTASPIGPVSEIARLADGQGIAINGVGAGDLAGFSVSAAGDVNGDGIGDILIGAPGAGQSYVILGEGNANEAPEVLGVETADLVYDELGGPQIITASLSVVDNDDTDLTGASIAITGGLDAGNDQLLFTDQNGITGSYDAAAGVLSLSGIASLADYEAALLSVVYENAFASESTAVRTISFTVNDAVNTSAAGTRTISFLVDNNINGTGLNDNLSGGFGDDQIFGSGGNDFLFGDSGNDSLFGDAGNDTLYGGAGDDVLSGGANNDRLFGGNGANALDGGTGFDRAFYTSASGAVRLNLATGGTFGDAAGDTYVSIEGVLGSSFSDNITGDNLANDLFGNDGNDVLSGADGNDRLFGGGGNDLLSGGAGADLHDGGAGFDSADYRGSTAGVALNMVTGGTGGDAAGDRFVSIERVLGSNFDDSIEGSAVRDTLMGLAGDDTLIGGGGNDRLTGGAGADVLDGGAGTDAVYYNAASAGVIVDLLAGGTSGEAAGDSYISIESVFGSGFNDSITGDAGANSLFGNGGADVLRGGDGNDRLFGGDGNDTLFGGAGSDIHDGGAGSDRVFYSTSSSGVTVNLINTALNTGDATGDTFVSIENIGGSQHNDVLTGNSSDNVLIGLSGNDVLNGARGNDRLFGGNGDDRLLGGAGDDIMLGQAGSDTYVIRANAGNDRILGFEDGLDIIEFRNGPADFAALTITQIGADTLIVSVNGELTLSGFTATDLDATDFTFFDPAPPAELPSDKQIVSEDLGAIGDVSDEPIVNQDLVAAFLSENHQEAPIIYMDMDGHLTVLAEGEELADYAEIIGFL